ncbi:hypothetical protein ABZY31_10905 [Streptomyces sp. NPDC006529]|uniref:hypothetical protein n=1 Tax=Streptomyces sp. NPDC006529 TaxID=3157177 RepID=UPI0033BB6D9D
MGVVLLLLFVLALALVGVFLWWLGVSLPEGQARRMEQQLATDTRLTGQALQHRAQDGTLTDDELKDVSPGPWAIRRDEREIRVAMSFLGPRAEYQCWSFTLKTPLGPRTSVTAQPDEAACDVRVPSASTSPAPR